MTLGNPNNQERICGIPVFSELSITGVWWSVTGLHLMHNKRREPEQGARKEAKGIGKHEILSQFIWPLV